MITNSYVGKHTAESPFERATKQAGSLLDYVSETNKAFLRRLPSKELLYGPSIIKLPALIQKSST